MENVVFVCCACEPDGKLDNRALALFLKQCPTHGDNWHRRMIRQADGTLALWNAHQANAGPPAGDGAD